jgi:hypothetical protein
VKGVSIAWGKILDLSRCSLANPYLRKVDIRFGNKSLHAKLAKCPKHQESVLDKQFLSGDRSTHGVQTSFSLFCTFHRWWPVHVGDIKGFSVRYVNWNVGFGKLSRRAVLSDISWEGRDIVIWIWSGERVTDRQLDPRELGATAYRVSLGSDVPLPFDPSPPSASAANLAASSRASFSSLLASFSPTVPLLSPPTLGLGLTTRWKT